MTNEHLISVILPCYNGAEYLVPALESLLWQTSPHWECLFIDDGSIDASAQIFKNYALMDQRFQYFYQKNQGLAAARNAGLALAKGSFIQFLDDDDVLLPHKLETCLEHLTHHPSVSVVFSDYVLMENASKFYQTLPAKFPVDSPLESFLFHWNENFIIPVHSYMFRREVCLSHKFNPDLGSHAEDVECWIRMAMDNITMIYLDFIGVVYRTGGNSMTSQEYQLISKKIRIIDDMKSASSLHNLQSKFDRAQHSLNSRLVNALFMEKRFREGIQTARKEWIYASSYEKVKMIGWLILMLFVSKHSVVQFRSWLVEHTNIRWGGWKKFRPYRPSPQLLDLVCLSVQEVSK